MYMAGGWLSIYYVQYELIIYTEWTEWTWRMMPFSHMLMFFAKQITSRSSQDQLFEVQGLSTIYSFGISFRILSR